jgi:hypothetical protein
MPVPQPGCECGMEGPLTEHRILGHAIQLNLRNTTPESTVESVLMFLHVSYGVPLSVISEKVAWLNAEWGMEPTL